MLRRDYILRMVQEFIEALARLRALKEGRLWRQAAGTVDEELQRLLGADAGAIAKLSDTELLARLIQGGPTQAVREKTLMVTRLLSEAGDIAAARGESAAARESYLRGINLLLDTLAGGDVSDFPDFVPRVEGLVAALAGERLPVETLARLMQHYERAGEFGKAEDALFALFEAEPDRPGIAEFGLAFYRRLENQSDDSLAAGNLPRPELVAGQSELRRRQKAPV